MILLFGFIFLAYCYYRSIGFIPIYRAIAAFFLISLVLYHIPVNNFISEEVCFINVGQGDSCLVRRGTTSVLIDTGGLTYTDLAKESLIPHNGLSLLLRLNVYSMFKNKLQDLVYNNTKSCSSLQVNL